MSQRRIMSDADGPQRRASGPSSARVRRAWVAAAGSFLALFAASVQAFDIERLAARYEQHQYRLTLVAHLDAPPAQVVAVLRDYAHYPSLDPRILEADVLERPEEHVVVLATRLRVCLGWFCREVSRVERVTESPLAFVAHTDPARSDLRFGITRTTLEPEGSGTRVQYSTAVAPGFWVPPFPRRWMLDAMSDATVGLFRSVERRAARSLE